jgi:RNA polymerase sigma-70 factor (ECF subfamily)
LRHASHDQAAWGEFVERCGRKISGCCRHWGLQEADAEDVTQDVLLKLAEKRKTFDYYASGSFRAWLKTLTHRLYALEGEAERLALGLEVCWPRLTC